MCNFVITNLLLYYFVCLCIGLKRRLLHQAFFLKNVSLRISLLHLLFVIPTTTKKTFQSIILFFFYLGDEQDKEKKTCISMEEWIDVWGTIVGKAKRMDDFPMWLQYYPKVLFDIINRSGMYWWNVKWYYVFRQNMHEKNFNFSVLPLQFHYSPELLTLIWTFPTTFFPKMCILNA